MAIWHQTGPLSLWKGGRMWILSDVPVTHLEPCSRAAFRRELTPSAPQQNRSVGSFPACAEPQEWPHTSSTATLLSTAQLCCVFSVPMGHRGCLCCSLGWFCSRAPLPSFIKLLCSTACGIPFEGWEKDSDAEYHRKSYGTHKAVFLPSLPLSSNHMKIFLLQWLYIRSLTLVYCLWRQFCFLLDFCEQEQFAENVGEGEQLSSGASPGLCVWLV